MKGEREMEVVRTGDQYSFASCEFKVTFDDGCEATLWSPPWHEMTLEEEDTRTLEVAESMKEHPHILDN